MVLLCCLLLLQQTIVAKINPNLEHLLLKKENIKAKIAIIENDEDIEKVDTLNDELEDILEEISKHCSDRNKEIVKQFIGDSDFGLEGFNQIKTWSLKKLSPKNVIEPPAAKKDGNGKIVTDTRILKIWLSKQCKIPLTYSS